MVKMMEDVVSHARIPFKNAPFTDFSKPENRQAKITVLAK